MSVSLHTSAGDIKLELYCQQVPLPCANFLALCASGVYNNISFHRIIPSFIIQSGATTSSTSKSLSSKAAFKRRLPDQTHPQLTFSHAGVVAYANAGRLSTKGIGSQFFITLVPAPHLDDTCTIFAKVIHGFDTVEAISKTKIENDRPLNPPTLISVSIHANPFANGDIPLDIPAAVS